MPTQLARCLVKHTVIRSARKARLVNERVVGLQHGEMHLRNQGVRIIPWVTDECDAFRISLKISSPWTKQKLRWIVPLKQKWMTNRSVSVKALQVELRTPCIA